VGQTGCKSSENPLLYVYYHSLTRRGQRSVQYKDNTLRCLKYVVTNDHVRNRNASVTKVTGNGLDDRVRFVEQTWNFSLCRHYHTGSAVQTFCPVGPQDFFPVDVSTGVEDNCTPL
jgi:hypothetical protein